MGFLEGEEHLLEREQRLDGSLDEVFAPFADAGNHEALTPPWLRGFGLRHQAIGELAS